MAIFRAMGQPTRKYLEVEAGLKGTTLAQLVTQLRSTTPPTPWRKIAPIVTARSGVEVTDEGLRQWFVGRRPVGSEQAA